MANLSIRFIGEVQVLRDGQPLALPPSRKTRGLLAYLALNSRTFTREHLCELLWEIPDDPRGALRWSLSKLRRLVDDEQHTRISANRTCVGFEAENADIDVTTLTELAAGDLTGVATDELLSAADTYSGAFLDGLELSDFYDFHTWTIGQREKVSRAQAGIQNALVSRFEEQPAQRYVHAQRWAGLTPWEENAHLQLVRALADQGRREEALKQVELAEQKLASFGVETSGALRRSIRRGPGKVKKLQPRQTEESQPLPASRHEAIRFATGKVIGRDREIAELVPLFNHVHTHSQANMVLLLGEAGMGKSALFRTVKGMAREVDVTLLEADAFESEIVRPFALWNDAFRRNPDIEIPDVLHGDTPLERDKLFAGLDEVIKRECEIRTLVIMFDDLQWCDESSAAALHYLLRMEREQPLFVLVSARESELKENRAVQQALRGLRSDQLLQEVRLGPLAQDDMEQFIASAAPGVDASRLARESGGNPLMALVLARAEREGSDCGSLVELVNDRLSRLDHDAAEVVLWSSVLAPDISLKTLESVTELSLEQLQAGLEAAQNQGILLPAPRGFRFFHDLIGRAVYDQIAPARRQAMHHRVAGHLEVASALNLELAADLAHHAGRCGDDALAARAMVSAGRLCLRFYANDDAMNLASTGIEYASRLSDMERLCLTLELSEVRLAAAPIEDWEKAANEYVELAEQALDHGALPAARLGYQLASSLRWMHGDWALARSDSLQAERVSRGGTDEEHILGMAETAKCLALLERDLPQADAMLMEAQALTARRSINCPAISEAAGILRYYEGKYDQAEEDLMAARTQCKAQGDRIAEFQANEYLFMISFERGDIDAAQHYCNTLVSLGEKVREGSELPFAKALDELLRYVRKEKSDALEAVLQDLRDMDAKHRLSYVLNRLSQHCLQREELDLCIEYAGEALACTLALSRPSETMLARITLAQAYQKRGSEEQCAAELREIKHLYGSGIARWARQRAKPMLKSQTGDAS